MAEQNGEGKFIQYAAHRMGISPGELRRFIDEYNDMQVLYRSAIREMSTRLEVLDDEFQYRHKRNPIHSIQTRLKSPRSMMEKLDRRNLAPRIEVLRNELTDIAGIRVICSYVDDIYLLAELLYAQDGLETVHAHDYIKRPKPNGYRSLHVVVRVPVRLSSGVEKVPVELQIRTIAMDFWASLEHQLRYKTQASVPREVVHELRSCAESIAELDKRMQKIYHRLESIESNEDAYHSTEFK